MPIAAFSGAASSSRGATIKVKIDNMEKSVSGQFHYRDDPVVTSVRPEKTIASGGLPIEVRRNSAESYL